MIYFSARQTNINPVIKDIDIFTMTTGQLQGEIANTTDIKLMLHRPTLFTRHRNNIYAFKMSTTNIVNQTAATI